jgi:hypothetical protein
MMKKVGILMMILSLCLHAQELNEEANRVLTDQEIEALGDNIKWTDY